MLDCWLTDESQWSKNRTRRMFGTVIRRSDVLGVEDLHLDEELIELD